MKARNWAMAVVILFGSIHFISCSTTQSAIVGRWQQTNGGDVMEFFKDGTMSVQSGGMNLGGKYTFVENQRVKIELGGLGALTGPSVANTEISGDLMTLRFDDGRVWKYRRLS